MDAMQTIDQFTRPAEYLSPLDDALGRMIRRWADGQAIPMRRRVDEDWREHALVGPAMDRLMGDLGLQRLLFPEDLGGLGLGHSDYLATGSFRVAEEIARADSGLAVAACVTLWPLLMICVEPHVNRRLCEDLAPMFCDTTRARYAANAMTEPQGGADIENLDLLGGRTIRTTAKRQGESWVINGHKLWPTNTGGVADLLAVVCTTRPGSSDPADFAVIFVPADTEGVTQGGPYRKAGMAADKNSDVWFEDVRVPLHHRACGPGADAEVFRELIAFGNLISMAFVSGVLMNTWEILSAFAAQRGLGTRALREHDAFAAVLADLAATTEVTRIVGYQYARMLDRPDLYGPRGSAELVSKGRAHKYFACDRAMACLEAGLDLMADLGPERAFDLEKHYRDLKIVQLWMGGKQLCQMETARWFYGCETL